MPPKGYKKPPAVTADDYASSSELAAIATRILIVVAKKHGDLPSVLAALSLTQQALKELEQRCALSPDADRPGEGI